MLKIASAVEQVVRSSDFAVLGLQSNLLNLSAYATSIQNQVNELTKKDVQIPSIVVALSRLQKELQTEDRFLPQISADSISVTSGLVEIGFSKDADTLKSLQKLYNEDTLVNTYLTVTQGLREITIITTEESFKKVKELFKHKKPGLEIHNIACITLLLSPRYTYTRNTFYALLKLLAPRGINVIELLTTFTEISFLVEEKDWEKTFSIFNQVLNKGRSASEN